MTDEASEDPVVLADLRSSLEAARRESEALRAIAVELLAVADGVLDESRLRSLGHERVLALLDEVAGLRRAMESRAVIEQAKGILIATTGCDADEAFELLVVESQHENRKLRELADELVARNVDRSH